MIDSSGWKILVGGVGEAAHVGPLYPNLTSSWSDSSIEYVGLCADTEYHLQFPYYDPTTQMYNGACLYNVFTDPNENNNVATLYPDIVKRLSLSLFQVNQTTWYNDRGTLTDIACQVSESSWGGALGPFVMNDIPLVSFASGIPTCASL